MTFTLTSAGASAFLLGVLTVLGTSLLIKFWRWTLKQDDYSVVIAASFSTLILASLWVGLFLGAFR